MRYPCNVVHLLGTAQPEGTGIASIVGGLASGLDSRRYRVHAWFLGESGPLADMLEARGARVRFVGWTRGKRDPIVGLRFCRALRGVGRAIFHQHAGGRAPRILARSSRFPVVLHLHGRVTEAQGAVPHLLDTSGADVVVAVSHAVAGCVRHRTANVVYSGTAVEPTIAQTIEDGPVRVFGTAGRLVLIKDIANLLRAVSLLVRDIPNLSFEIAGEGPERGALEDQVRSLSLEHTVHFLGWRSDMRAVMRRWQVFVQSSLDEGLGIAALDAMAASVPVVATAVGGVPEVVVPGLTGYLVPPDNPVAMAEAIRPLLLDKATARAMGTAARRRIECDFSVDRMVSQISTIYDELVARTSRDRRRTAQS